MYMRLRVAAKRATALACIAVLSGVGTVVSASAVEASAPRAGSWAGTITVTQATKHTYDWTSDGVVEHMTTADDALTKLRLTNIPGDSAGAIHTGEGSDAVARWADLVDSQLTEEVHDRTQYSDRTCTSTYTGTQHVTRAAIAVNSSSAESGSGNLELKFGSANADIVHDVDEHTTNSDPDHCAAFAGAQSQIDATYPVLIEPHCHNTTHSYGYEVDPTLLHHATTIRNGVPVDELVMRGSRFLPCLVPALNVPGYQMSTSGGTTIDFDLTFTPDGDVPPAHADFDSAAPVGNSNAVHFSSNGSENATSYTWDFGDDTSAGAGSAPTHNYAKPGRYLVNLTIRNATSEDSISKTVVANPAATFAPDVVLHPDEKRYPYDPARFIANSSLQWSHDRLCRDHTLATHPSAARLGNGSYTHQRTQDGICRHTGRHYKSNTLTAPRDGRSQLPAGEKLEGFYLNLDNDSYNGTKDTQSVPMYFEYKDGRYITYWIFYAFNDWVGATDVHGAPIPLVERHEGDWEHITVKLKAGNDADAVAYYEHYCQPAIKTWDEMEAGFGSDTGLSSQTHPIVFAARGGHGSYWKPGTWKDGEGEAACPKGEMVEDHTDLSAKHWRPWTGGGLVDARTQPWYNYGGLWGRVGVASQTYSNGILGPSKWKFADPKVNTVPPDWQ